METRCASVLDQTTPPQATTDDPGKGHALERIRRRLSRNVGARHYERYFGKQTRLKVSEGCLSVTVPNRFMAELLDRRFGPALREAACAELASSPPAGGDPAANAPLKIHIETEGFEAPATPAPKAEPPARENERRKAPRRVRHGAGQSDTRYRLEDFVVGACNRMAHSAALRLTDGEEPEFRRLFIHGACGLGKTHLLHGIAARFRARHPGAVVHYATGEEFTNEYINAVRTNTIDAFRKRHRDADLLCLDDAHFLSNKEKTQGELLHTFDALDLGGARLILASDGHPRDIQRLSEQLVSRFLAGAVVRLESPDPETRQKIVRAIARRRELVIDDDAVRLIAQRSARASGPDGQGGSIRELEGLMTQVEAVLRLMPEIAPGGRIGPSVVRRALGLDETSAGPQPGRPTRPIPMHVIISEVCREFRVEHDAFTGTGRHKRVVMARSVCAYLARSLTTFSFPEIARHMGRPTHSTVLSAAARVKSRIDGADNAGELGKELGAEFAGLLLREVCDRLARDIRRVADRA